MPIRSSISFTYDGRSSDELGIYNVNVNSGMLSEPFVATRNIQEIKKNIGKRKFHKRYFQGIVTEPLEFTVSFAFQDQFDSDKLRDVARWLTMTDYFKPLVFSDNPERIYYAIVIDAPELVHNGLSQGYVNLKFRCDSPYSYSPTYVSNEYNYSVNDAVNGSTLEIDNYGDENCKPEISITKVGAGDVKIVNISNGGVYFQLSGLSDAEDIYIDSENEYIETSIPLTYRYDNFTGDYMELLRGVNYLTVYGNAKVSFRYSFKLIQG